MALIVRKRRAMKAIRSILIANRGEIAIRVTAAKRPNALPSAKPSPATTEAKDLLLVLG